MKYDEFAFLNQQLAGMLKSGIPLEGALRQLCSTLRRSKLRGEFEQLERDLSNGIPLKQSLAERKLPEFYKQMIAVGIESNDLPAVLTLLADYYQKINLLWTRLKGLMVYPLIVLAFSFALSIFLVKIAGPFVTTMLAALSPANPQPSGFIGKPLSPTTISAGLLVPMVLLGLLCLAALSLILVPAWRKKACWILPGFKEAHLSRFASSFGLMLQSGCQLSTALALLQRMENQTPLGRDLALWQMQLASGCQTFSDVSANSKIIPPLFIWLVASEQENWEIGLQRAAEIYYARALYRTELLLGAILPVSVVALGFIVLVQLISLVRMLYGTVDVL